MKKLSFFFYLIALVITLFFLQPENKIINKTKSTGDICYQCWIEVIPGTYEIRQYDCNDQLIGVEPVSYPPLDGNIPECQY